MKKRLEWLVPVISLNEIEWLSKYLTQSRQIEKGRKAKFRMAAGFGKIRTEDNGNNRMS